MQINKNLGNINHTPSKRNNNDIKFIVIHYVGALGDAKANTDYYKSQYVGASADFWVGFNGDVWQGNDYQNYYSWAIGGGLQGSGPHPYYQVALNNNSVSIEMCVHKRNHNTMNATDKDWYFEDATVDSAAWLTASLMKELDIDIDHVIRHYDVNAKICPNPFVYDTGRTTWKGFKDKVLGYFGGSGSNTPDNGSNSSHPTLSYGATGAAVTTMQALLIALGYTCGASGADGNWGLDTNKAVRAFQSANASAGVIVDEICGPATWRVLEATYKALTTSQLAGDTYPVKAGDTLYRIAQAAGTTVDKLAQLNGLSNPAKIAVGQVLKLPGGQMHTIKAGDTLSALARVYGTTISKIVEANRSKYPAITANHIVVGWVLKI